MKTRLKEIRDNIVPLLAVALCLVAVSLAMFYWVYAMERAALPLDLVSERQGGICSIEQIDEWNSYSSTEQRLQFAERYGVTCDEVEEAVKNFTFGRFLEKVFEDL